MSFVLVVLKSELGQTRRVESFVSVDAGGQHFQPCPYFQYGSEVTTQETPKNK